jgi:hypothetical protein
LASNQITFRDIAKVAGFINSLYLAVGPATRQMHFAIMQKIFTTTLNEALTQELQFWHTSIDSFEGFHINPPIATSYTYAAVYNVSTFKIYFPRNFQTLTCERAENGIGFQDGFFKRKRIIDQPLYLQQY